MIDSDAPAVRALSLELSSGAADDEEFARRCFLWVRDQVRHSADFGLPVVTCSASEVLRHRAGLCYAKSHLLAALLRAGSVPAALCYQRLASDSSCASFCLHGLVSVHLRRHGWYRIDPRGEKPGVSTAFCPPVERLAFTPSGPGEKDISGRFIDALPVVISALRRWSHGEALMRNLPDDPRLAA